MSTTIDEKVVEMRFDNKDFEKNVSETMNTIGSLKKSLNFEDSVKSFDNIEKASKKVKFDGLTEAIETVKVKFSALQIAVTRILTNIVDDAYYAGKRIIKSLTIDPISQGFSEYELKMNSVQTIMSSTGETIETVNRYLDELNTYADKTIYSFSDMTANIGKFTNAGVKLDDAVKAIQGVSNVAAVSGANTNEASRAMYNFAQALSSGAVKLIDWKSIENANMATVEFKQNLIDTAVAMGTLKKVDDQYIALTSGNSNKKTKEAFTATSKFNDALSDQWMTTEVLVQTLSNYSTDIREMTDADKLAYEAKLKSIGYTNEQIKSIEELGKKAFDAAQDVKTFTQLLDTLKEAAGSGWAQTFEILFGDLNEAKKIWTAVSNEIGGIIDASAKRRNELLKLWDLLGGRDQIIASVVNVWNNLKNIINAVKDGFHDIFPPLTAKNLLNFTNALKNLTESLMLNGDELDKIKRIAKGFASAIDIAKQFVLALFNSVKKLFPLIQGGASIFLEAAAKLGDWVTSVRDWIVENDIFTKAIDKVITAIGAIAVSIDNLVQSITGYGVIELFQMLGDKVSYFYEMLKLVFSAISTDNADVFAVLSQQFKDLTGIELEDSKLYKFLLRSEKILSGIKDLVVNLIHGDTFKDAISKFFGDSFDIDTSKFFAFWDGFAEDVKKAWDKVSGAFKGMTGGFKSFKDSWSTAWEKISGVFVKAKDTIVKAWDGIKPTLSEITGVDLTGVIKFGTILEILFKPFQLILNGIQKLFEGLGWAIKNFGPTIITVLKSLGEVFIDLVQKVAKAVSNADFNKVIDFFTSGALAVMIAKFTKMLLGLKDAGKVVKEIGDDGEGGFSIFKFFKTLAEQGKEIGEKISVLFDGIRGVFKTWQQDLQANMLLKIAAAIGILAVSLTVLSGIDQDRLIGSLGAVTAMFAELMATFKIMSGAMVTKSSLKDVSAAKDQVMGFTQLTTFVVGISASLLIMSVALKKIASLEPKQLLVGIAAIGALFTEVIAVFKILSKDKDLIVKMPSGLVAMSTAIYILSTAIKKLGKMDPKQMLQGIGGIGAVFVEILAFIQLLNKKPKIKDGDAADIVESTNSVAAVAGGLVVLAVALRMMVTSVKSLGKMDPDALIQGLFGMFSVLVAIIGFIKYFESPAEGEAGIMRIASMMLVMANAMILIAAAMKILGTMNFEEIGTACLGIFGVFTSIVLTVQNLQEESRIARIAAGMVVFGLALIELGAALKVIASIKSSSLLKAVLAIDALLGTLMLYSMFTDGTKALQVSGGLTAFAAALLILGPALKILGTLDAGAILAVVVTLSSVFTVLIVAAKASDGLVVKMLAISGAMALLGVAVLALGTGMTALAVGLTSLSASGPAVIEFLALFVATLVGSIPKVITSIIKSIIDSILTLGSNLLTAVLKVINDVTPVLIETLLNIVDQLLTSVEKHLPSIVQKVCNIIVKLLDILGKEIPRLVDSLLKFVMNLLSGLSEAIGKNLKNIVNTLSDVVINIVMGALDAVFPWLVDWFIDGTDDVFEVADRLTEREKEIISEVQAMSDTYHSADEARKESMKSIDSEYGYIKELKDEYNKLIDSNGNIIKGFEDRAQMIKTTLAEAMGISVDQVDNLIDANGRLSDSFDKVMYKMQAEAYLEANKSFYQEAITNKRTASNNYKELLLSEKETEAELDKVAKDLEKATKEANKAFDEQDHETYFYANEKVEQLEKDKASLVKTLSELSTARKQAEEQMVGYSAEIRNYNELQYAMTTENVELMGETMNQLENGYISAAEGTKETLTKQLNTAREHYLKLLQIKKETPELVSQEEIDEASYWLGVYGGQLYKLENGYTQTGIAASRAMNRMTTDVQNGGKEVVKAAENTEKGVVDAVDDLPDEVADIDSDAYDQIDLDVDKINELLETEGPEGVMKYINGMASKEPDLTKESEKIADLTTDPFEKVPKEMENIGINSMLGLIEGAKKTAPESEKVFLDAAEHQIKIIKERLGIESPSRVFREIGEQTMNGLILGILDLKDKLDFTSEGVANDTITTVSDILSTISEIINSDIDTSPTIKPVLDLTDISSGVSDLNDMVDANKTLELAAMATGEAKKAWNIRTNSPLSVNNTDIVSVLTGLREDVNGLNEKVGKLQVVMDTGALVGQIAAPIDYALGKQTMYKGRGI